VTRADLAGDRKLELTHRLHNDVPLAEPEARTVLGYIADLWGFGVELRGLGADDQLRYSFELRTDGANPQAATARARA
jgi:spore cortex formation protein SpoVR/YcgB (stage V sporulation)